MCHVGPTTLGAVYRQSCVFDATPPEMASSFGLFPLAGVGAPQNTAQTALSLELLQGRCFATWHFSHLLTPLEWLNHAGFYFLPILGEMRDGLAWATSKQDPLEIVRGPRGESACMSQSGRGATAPNCPTAARSKLQPTCQKPALAAGFIIHALQVGGVGGAVYLEISAAIHLV